MSNVLGNFSFEVMDPIPPDSNPFSTDAYHMGTILGTNVMAMYANHSNKVMEYVILVHTPTGQRVKIRFPEYNQSPRMEAFVEMMTQRLIPEEEGT